jgi:hypothetical protein
MQLSEVQEVSESRSVETVFHEVGSRSEKWLILQGQHDAIIEEIIASIP